MKFQTDLIVKAKYILPMDNHLSVIKDGAMAVEGNKIVAVGKADEVEEKFGAKETIDSGNSIAMPGLVNTHTHAAMTYFRGLADDLPLAEWLQKYIWPAEKSNVNPDFVRKASELAILEMIKSGTTCFNDMYFFEDVTAEAARAAGMRAVIGEGILSFPTPSCQKFGKAIDKTLEFFDKFAGDELIGVAIAPHAVYTCEKEVLRKVGEISRERNALVHIHLSETEKEVADCRRKFKQTPAEYLDGLGLLSGRTVAAHCVWADDDDLAIFKEKGVKVSHNPASNMKLAAGTAPVVEMLKRGIIVGLGTDGAASNNRLDLFSEMRTAALLHKAHLSDPAVMNAREAVKMATINGARVLGMEDRIGSLEPGKRADVVTIGLSKPHLQPFYDPYSHLVYCANGADVDNVMVNGRLIMRHRRTLKMDEERILQEAGEFRIKY